MANMASNVSCIATQLALVGWKCILLLTIHRHPMCAEIIEQFQKCHLDHPIAKFFGECTDLKIKLDRCFRQEKALKRKANFEESKKLKERLQAFRKENAKTSSESREYL